MAIRLSGLNSGIDTDSIVEALMSAQRTKQTKVEAKQTKLEWKKELWGELNTKIYDFYKDTLGKIKLQGTYKTKAANSSDTSKVTATATSSASEGTYKIKVNSLASAQYVTSGKLQQVLDKDGNKVNPSSSTKLVDLVDGNGDFTFTAGTQIKVSAKGGTSTVLVDENTTIADFVKVCANVGLSASFDTTQQRFFIGSSTSGADQSFTISSGELSQEQLNAVSDWKEAVGYSYLSSDDKAAVDKIFDKLQAGTTTYDKVSKSLQGYVEKAQKSAVNSYYKKQLTDGYNNDYFVYDADTGKKVGLTDAGLQALKDSKTTDAAKDAVDNLSDEKKISQLEALVTKKVTADLKTDEYKDKIADAIASGITDDPNVSSFLSSTAEDRIDVLKNCAENYNTVMSNIADNSGQLAGLGLAKVDGSKVEEGSDASGMVVVKASDSSITFNGATLTSSTSSMTVNGLTLDVLDTTPGSEVTISVTKDTSAIYDTIKDFISEYNSILKTMNSYYNAASSKGYDVLTDEQKEAMTDDEVEKWEDKIKSSLLRRDDTLSSLISSFRNNMMGSYTASNGKKYSLSSLGIGTSTDYTENGLLHIKGDEDDSEYADEDNKLEKMLLEDPDLVMEIMTGLTNNLYNDLQKKSSSTTMSSIFTFYNDKEMNSQLSDYKKEISKWETKLAELENRYYSQFTAMEKAMASLNSQQSYFSSMLG